MAARVARWLAQGDEAQASLVHDGYAVFSGFLPEAARQHLLQQVEGDIGQIADWKWYKNSQGDGQEMRPRTVHMNRLGFGQGTYTYLCEPLPPPLQELRDALYTALAPVANRDIERHRREVAPKPFKVGAYPASLEAFHGLCRSARPAQPLPTCLALQYSKGGHNLTHRDIYGCVSFPYQALCVLTVPGKDFRGGEFYVQPRKDADDRRHRIPLRAGDLLVFQSSLWHGSERVLSGRRVAVGLQFHLAQA